MTRRPDPHFAPRASPRTNHWSPDSEPHWIRACKGGDKACSDFSVAGPFAEWVLLATIVMGVGCKLDWDCDKMQITNNKEANKYIPGEFCKSGAKVWSGKELSKA